MSATVAYSSCQANLKGNHDMNAIITGTLVGYTILAITGNVLDAICITMGVTLGHALCAMVACKIKG